MNINLTMPHKSFVVVRVALKLNICQQWRDRRKWQKHFGLDQANRWHNNTLRETINAYRDMDDWHIAR